MPSTSGEAVTGLWDQMMQYLDVCRYSVLFDKWTPCVLEHHKLNNFSCNLHYWVRTRSSATTETAHNADVRAQSLSLWSNLRPVCNLHPLDSPTYYVLVYQHLCLHLGRVSISILHLCCRWKWKKVAGNRRTFFGVRVTRTLDYPTVKLNPR